MGLVDKIEKTLERKVTGLFSKTFKSGLEPVEIASAIRHEMDSRASILTRERILVPNRYLIHLSPQDFERLSALGQPLIDELTDLAKQHCSKQGFQYGEVLAIELKNDPKLVLGQLEVISEGANLAISWVPVLEIGGKSHELTKARTTVGRDGSADIQVNDNGLSRKHFEIVWDGSKAALVDLKSTNGTKVSGKRVEKAILGNESAISAGRTNFRFKVIARAK
ncbi:MAG: FhaA domain-containing protein [Actinomycetota bacterium]